jgi:hypothetical protein
MKRTAAATARPPAASKSIFATIPKGVANTTANAKTMIHTGTATLRVNSTAIRSLFFLGNASHHCDRSTIRMCLGAIVVEPLRADGAETVATERPRAIDPYHHQRDGRPRQPEDRSHLAPFRGEIAATSRMFRAILRSFIGVITIIGDTSSTCRLKTPRVRAEK